MNKQPCMAYIVSMTTTDYMARMRAVSVLHTAIKIITKQGWTRRAFARDSFGITCSVSSPYAQSFCVTGALDKACLDRSEDDDSIHNKALYALNLSTRCRDAMIYNDARGRKRYQVVALVKRAISRLKKGKLK